MDEALEIHVRELVGEILTGVGIVDAEITVEESDEPGWSRLRVRMQQIRAARVDAWFVVKIDQAKARTLLDNPASERVTYAAMIRDALANIWAQAEQQQGA